MHGSMGLLLVELFIAMWSLGLCDYYLNSVVKEMSATLIVCGQWNSFGCEIWKCVWSMYTLRLK